VEKWEIGNEHGHVGQAFLRSCVCRHGMGSGE
jgi:hypothetical protein